MVGRPPRARLQRKARRRALQPHAPRAQRNPTVVPRCVTRPTPQKPSHHHTITPPIRKVVHRCRPCPILCPRARLQRKARRRALQPHAPRAQRNPTVVPRCVTRPTPQKPSHHHTITPPIRKVVHRCRPCPILCPTVGAAHRPGQRMRAIPVPPHTAHMARGLQHAHTHTPARTRQYHPDPASPIGSDATSEPALVDVTDKFTNPI